MNVILKAKAPEALRAALEVAQAFKRQHPDRKGKGKGLVYEIPQGDFLAWRDDKAIYCTRLG